MLVRRPCKTVLRLVLRFAGMPFTPRDLLYRTYERRLESVVRHGPKPEHVGVILDGNRRWARAMGYADEAEGHRQGAHKIDELLSWCAELQIPVVTLWLLSTENLERDPAEVRELLEVIEEKVSALARDQRWHVRAVGSLELLPERTRQVLEEAMDLSSGREGLLLNVAVGYGGRQEIADAVRGLLHEHAEKGASLEEVASLLDVEQIAEHLYTRGQPDPDLVIRTSG